MTPAPTTKGKNKVIEILESKERIDGEINFIVNSFRNYGEDEKANKMRKMLQNLVNHVYEDCHLFMESTL